MRKFDFKKFRLFIIVVIINIILAIFYRETSKLSLHNTLDFLIEVLKILPPVMVLMGLLEVWVPRSMFEIYLGDESGFRGSLIAILIGSVAAGPLFAAFPIAISLRHKGVSLSNIVIFLGSWATIKVPMLVMESNFIGLRFALLRLVITIPFILLIGYFMEKWAKIKEF